MFALTDTKFIYLFFCYEFYFYNLLYKHTIYHLDVRLYAFPCEQQKWQNDALETLRTT